MKQTILLALSLLSISSHSLAMSEERFDQIIVEIVELYSQEIKDQNLEFEVVKHWDNPTVNAGVNHNGKKATFNIYGGYAIHPAVTEDKFAMTVCHEIGHIVAGEPTVKPTNKLSSEGQSDYFASSKCMKRYLKGKDNTSFLKLNPPTLFMLEKCSTITNSNERLVCLRTFLAIKSFEVLMSQLSDQEISIEASSEKIAPYTNYNDYPSNQCRIDTLKAGALGLERPACWYVKPEKEVIEHPYIIDSPYPEARFIGSVSKVNYTSYGCHVEISEIDFFGASYLSPLDEDELWNEGIYKFGSCPFEKGGQISGTATGFKGKIYLNINPVDKFL